MSYLSGDAPTGGSPTEIDIGIPIIGASANQFLITDASGNLASEALFVDGITIVGDGITTPLQAIGAAASISIGSPITGGNLNDVLFVDASGNLGQDDGFFYSDFGEIFHVGFAADSSVSIVVAPLSGLYALGDYGNIYNQTTLQLNDAAFQTTVSGVTGSVPDVAANSSFPIGTPGFVGSGPNDMEWNGYYDGGDGEPITYQVVVATVGNGIIEITSGGTFIVGETITVTAGSGIGSTATSAATDGSSFINFTNEVDVGTGFSNPGDTITGSTSGATGTISSYTQNPDTFNWSAGSNTGNAEMNTTRTELIDNVFVLFASTTGHIPGDEWTWDYSLALGGVEMALDGTNYSWGMGDIDNVVKGQSFGIISSGTPDTWQFNVQDENGSYFHVAPIDAPVQGLYWLGNRPNIYGNGTYFYINDLNQDVAIYTDYGSATQVPLLEINGNRGHVTIGDVSGAVNNSYVNIRDNARQIESHVTIDPVNTGGNLVDAYDDLGSITLTPLGDTIYGSFKWVVDQTTGGIGFIGAGGDAADFPALGNDAVFEGHVDALGNTVSQALFDGGGDGTYQLASMNILGTNMSMLMNSTDWQVLGTPNNTTIALDDPSSTITLDANNVVLPELGGSGAGFVAVDNTGLLSFTTGTGGSPGGTTGQLQINVAGVFAGQTTTNHMQWLFTDSTRVASYLDSAGTYLSIDAGTGLYTMGDLSGGGHSNKIVLNDGSVQDFRYETGSAKYLFLSHTLNLFQMGDMDGSHNSSFLQIDDGAKLLEFSSGGHNYLKFDVTNKIYEMGDLSAVGNSTQFIIDDQNQRIAMDANLLVQLSAQTIKRTGGIQDSTVTIVPFNIGTAAVTLNQYDFEFSGSTGTPHMNLPTGVVAPVGTIFMFSDLDCIAAANNITIDAGTSNFIVGSSSAQTFVMNQNGQSITLKKVTATQWKVQ